MGDVRALGTGLSGFWCVCRRCGHVFPVWLPPRNRRLGLSACRRRGWTKTTPQNRGCGPFALL